MLRPIDYVHHGERRTRLVNVTTIASVERDATGYQITFASGETLLALDSPATQRALTHASGGIGPETYFPAADLESLLQWKPPALSEAPAAPPAEPKRKRN